MASDLAPPRSTAFIGSFVFDPARGSEKAVFRLSKPLKPPINGTAADVLEVEMRAIDRPDLALLDEHHGKPIALAHGVIAALCDLTVDQVEQLAIDDFIMLASDALWQVSRLSIDMGLSHDFFFRAQAEGEDA